ncbi:MAG: tetratricopeptide repeat protein [Mariniblastus sp.]|nr:tetratricopeptide repeat protein [Mariniblastus sp.]
MSREFHNLTSLLGAHAFRMVASRLRRTCPPPSETQWIDHRINFSFNPETRDSRRLDVSHRLITSFLLLLGLLVACSGCQTFSQFTQKSAPNIYSPKQWADHGLEAFQNGHLDKARGLFSRAAEQNPNDFRVRANLARALHQSGDRQRSIIEMQIAADLSNGDPEMLVELGQMYLDAGQWLPARRQVELALESNHLFAPAWALSGKTAKSKGNYEQALADFQRALGYAPELTDVQLEIVDTYQRLGKPLRALSAAEQLLSKHPNDEQPESAIIAKGIALIELDQIGPAIDLLQAASERKNASSQIFVQLSQAELLANNLSKARLALARGKQNFPNLQIFEQLESELTPAEERVAWSNSINR